MADLLNVLLKQVINDDTVKALSKTADADTSKVEDLLTEAVPTLVSAMAKNSKTSSGAKALDKALDDHAGDFSSAKGLISLLTGGDSDDGAKILGHILGKDETKVEKKLAKSSGLDLEKVVTILCAIAPVILSLLGNTKQKTNTDSDMLGTLLTSLLGGSSSSSSKKEDTSDLATELIGDVLTSLLK